MRVEYHRLFRKQLAKLPVKIKRAFYARLELFIADKFHPLLNNHALTGKYAGCRSINVTGDFRAIFVEQSNSQVIFFDLDTHHNLFGK